MPVRTPFLLRVLILSAFTFLCVPYSLFAQQKFTVSGTIKSARNGETIIGATIKITGQSSGNISNEYGFYSITLPQGAYTMEISAVGLQPRLEQVVLDKNL